MRVVIKLFLGLFALLVVNQSVASEFDRLFTTEAERLKIDQQKQQAPVTIPESATAGSKIVQEAEKKIALDAVLVGKKTAIWVNRQLVRETVTIAGVEINPSHASVKGLWITTPKGKRLIKQGQIYLTDVDKVVERYEAI